MVKRKRPISVWIAQIIIGLYAAGMVLLLLWSIYAAFSQGVVNAEGLFIGMVMNVTFIAIFGGAFIGMANGKPWGRWLGVAALSILAIGGAITQTSRRLSGAEDTGLFSPYMIFS